MTKNDDQEFAGGFDDVAQGIESSVAVPVDVEAALREVLWRAARRMPDLRRRAGNAIPMSRWLSAGARSVWAKSVDEDGGWLPLWQHLDDTANVVSELVDRWLAPSVMRLLAADFAGDVEQARAALMFLAGVHDLGKATPAFAVQDSVLARFMGEAGLAVPGVGALVDRRVVPHAVAGHHLVVRWLVEQGWTKSAARAWGVVVGGHHGVPPDAEQERAARPRAVPELYGTGTWEAVQRELVEWVAARSGAAARLTAWREVTLSARFQVLATAVVIVADWIASDSELFPFYRGQPDDVQVSSERASWALTTLNLPAPWQPSPVEDVAALFAARFRLPPEAVPRPVQVAVWEAARAMPEPGLLIVEAPMGEGKTEAALAAAEVLAARWETAGVLMALPTQATSDAMFERMVSWLDTMEQDGQQVAGSITLGHGKAKLNRLFQGLMRVGRLGAIGCDNEGDGIEHALVAHTWLSGRKKALLANFAVVTIDQVLLAGLRSRHLMLRHLALAGKVVVIDEIHAYDAFMNSYLTKVLTWLGAYRVPVVALSATLPADQRRELVQAYQRGSHKVEDGDLACLHDDIGYPAVTWTHGTSVSTRAAEASGRGMRVAVETVPDGSDDLDALTTLLSDALSDGGVALIVRNTVRRVLATARHLERMFPGEVSVTHSRFIVADRARKDAELLANFGPPERTARRPERHIVVASPVVEQSLDVDFDLLVTDLAPIDLVLQRIGRLHRHQRGQNQQHRPPKLRSPRVYVTGVDFSLNPPGLEPATAHYVYDAHTLWRAAAVLRERFGGTIELPGDIAPLVQRAYGAEDVGPEEWRDAMTVAGERWRKRTARREDNARVFQVAAPGVPGRAVTGWVSAGVGEADDSAQGQGQVRDGAPSLEVLLVCHDRLGQWRTPVWLDEDDRQLPVPREGPPADDVAKVMASCQLRLPMALSTAAAEEELRRATPSAWAKSPLVYRYPVLVVDEAGWGQIAGRQVRYTPTSGLEVFDSSE